MTNPADIRIRNAHVLEMHELEMARLNGELLFLDASLFTSIPPTDVVDR